MPNYIKTAKLAPDNYPPNSQIIELYMNAIKDQLIISIDKVINDSSLTPEAKSTQLKNLQKNIETKLTFGDFKSTTFFFESEIKSEIKTKINSWYENQIKPLYDTKIASLATTKGTIEQLNLHITNLGKQSTESWKSYVNNLNSKGITSPDTQSAFNKYTSTTLMILWKRGAVTVKSLIATFDSLFKQAQVKPASTNQINNLANDAISYMPASTDSQDVQANWITRVSNMISDAIFGTGEEQLAKNLAIEYQNPKKPKNIEYNVQLLKSSGLINTTSKTTKGMILSIINDVQPNLSQAAQEEILQSIIMNDQTKEKPSLPDFLPTYDDQPEYIKAHPNLWNNSNTWSTNYGAFDPAKFNTWMTKTVKLINEKAKTANPVASTTGAFASTTGAAVNH